MLVLKADAAVASRLLRLRQALASGQRREGLRVTSVNSFEPHVTLAYGEVVPPIEEPIDPVLWTAREFVLISHVGRSRHEILGRWPLGGESALDG